MGDEEGMTNIRLTLSLWAFAIFKIPLLFFVRPRVVRLDATVAEIKIPLRRRTRNHLNSMYLGSLCTGADCVAGLMALQRIQKGKHPVNFVLKDLKGTFLKRPIADVHFTCSDGEVILKCLEETLTTGKRVEQLITVLATTPKVSGTEVVARFEITLSMRARG